MTKKNNIVKIIDNKDGSRSALIEVSSGRYKRANSSDLALGNVGNRMMNGVDLFNFARTSSPSFSSIPVTLGKESIVKQKILKALFYWETEPIVYKCIDLLAKLANDTFTISSEDKDIETDLRNWWKSIKGEEFLRAFFLEFFRSGNVPIMKTKVRYLPKNGFKKEGYEKYITGGYTILNPLNVTIKDSGIPGVREAYLKMNNDFINILKSGNSQETLKNILPEEFLASIRENNSFVKLPSNIFTMVYKDKQPYEEWAIPMIAHAFRYLDYKSNLMAMDESTTNGIKNRILMVTIGNDMYPCFDNKELENLAAKFNNPSSNLTIFWNHTLQIKYVEPDTSTLSEDKYEPVMNDIRCVFGISKALTGDNGDSSGNNVLNLKGMMEILQDARTAFIDWFYREINDVANIIANTKEDEVSVDFSTLNLKDENDFYRVLMQMVDRQIVSYETAMETIGYYFPKELKRLESEKQIREEKGILIAQKAPTQGGGEDKEDTTNPDTTKMGGRPKGGDKEGERKNSQNKPKTPSGIKSLGEFKKDFAIASMSGASTRELRDYAIKFVKSCAIQENVKNMCLLCLENMTLGENIEKEKEIIDNIFKNIE